MEQFSTCQACGQPMPVGHTEDANRPAATPLRNGALRQLRMARLAAAVIEGAKDRHRQRVQESIDTAKAEAEPPKPIKPHVTYNALLKYLEVAWGIDVEKARREILSPAACKALEAGASAIKVGKHRLVAIDGRITALVQKPKRLRPPRHQPRSEQANGDAVRKELKAYFDELAEGLVA